MQSLKIRMPGPVRPAALELNVRREPKLLIIYASYGDGHLQAARAIRDALELRGIPSHCVKLIDIMAAANPLINEVTRRFYMRSYSMMPSLYGWVYDRTRPMKHDSLFGGWLHSFGRATMRQLMLAERPDAIIYTFPAFAAPSDRRTRQLHRVPSMAVVTDFDLHCRWVHPHIDRYYVATEDLKAELIHHGIDSQRIVVSGIPVKRGFAAIAGHHYPPHPQPQSQSQAQTQSQQQLLPTSSPNLPQYSQPLITNNRNNLAAPRSALSLADLYRRYNIPKGRPLVLIMAGAQGVMPDVPAVCSALLRHPELAVALICGRNTELADAMKARFSPPSFSGSDSDESFNRLHIFGFVEPIHELMALADCLVTKPGGITLSEGLAAGLPLFIYRPVPGQERNNALYLQSRGAAFIAHHPEELSSAIYSLITSPIRLHNSRAASASLGRSGAADSIVLDILSQCPIMELEETSSISHIEGASSRDR